MNMRWLALFLVSALLCGCTGPETDTVPSEAFSETKPTDSVGFYDPYSTMELETDGAVRAYPLDTSDALGIRFLGDSILLFSGHDRTRLTLLAGENRHKEAEVTLSCPVFPSDPGVVVYDQGVTYVDTVSRELVFLDRMLTETERLPLPEGCGTVGLTADRSTLYYCTPDAVRALDLNTGLDRPVKEMHFPCQEVTALHCGDTVLQCSASYDDGNPYTLFFSAKDGALLYETQGDMSIWTQHDLYFTTHMDGEYRELISGSQHLGASVLVTDTEPFDIEPVLERQMVLLYSQESDDSTVLDCYHLVSGAHTAQVVLEGDYQPFSIQPDPVDHTLWFLCCDPYTGQNILCAWNPEQSATEDPENYLQPRWDWENPDLEGLAQCRALAGQISAKHGVQILIWNEATEVQPWDYTLVSEYQVPLIQKKLQELDAVLSCYPDGFLTELASQTDSGELNIGLVRFICGNADTGALESAAGLQYWDQDANAFLAVTLGQNMAQHIHHELFHVIDSRVLSSCSAYDNWNSLNPPDFQYGSGQHLNTELVTGDNRYFIDLYSMGYPKEDRARIMEYAMMAGQADTFASAPMQAKLRQLCAGIRETFHLEQSSEIYPWEQYLAEPLASSQ